MVNADKRLKDSLKYVKVKKLMTRKTKDCFIQLQVDMVINYFLVLLLKLMSNDFQ